MPRIAIAAGVTAALCTLLTACGSSSPASSSSTTGSSSGGSRVAAVTITADKGCTSNHLTFPAGGITFNVTNKDAAAVSEVEFLSGDRIVGERENLPPGFSGDFAVQVGAGTYTLYCPGAPTENTAVKVTGKASAPADSSVASLLAQGTKAYGQYVTTEVAALVTTTAALNTALHGTSLAAAQAAYMRARPYYEKIEPVAESFVVGKDNLDSDIDARINDVPHSQWTGFHRIEQIIFQQRTLKGTQAYGAELLAKVEELQKKTTGLTYQPTELANGAQELLNEVATSKITGEEERYSLIDLLDFAANDEGAEQAFAQLQPALAKIDSTLAATIQTQFTALDKLVNSYRTGANASGFKLYNQLTDSDKRALAAAVKAVQEPLDQVAAKVANV